MCNWAAGHCLFLDERLYAHGGILFRGFDVADEMELARFIQSVSGDPLEYRERSSPRSRVLDNIYTSTEHPADQSIFLHNENSYQRVWPLRIFFFCQTPATQGGETPIADCRRVLARISPETRERFEQKGWMYVRNFGDGFGLPWQTVFGTEIGAKSRITATATESRTSGNRGIGCVSAGPTRRPYGIPRPANPVWFNHCTFFHVSTLASEPRSVLQAEFDENDLPTQTYYGDGSPIEPQTLDELRAAYAAETVAFPWSKGDILMLDNMLNVLMAEHRLSDGAEFSGGNE